MTKKLLEVLKRVAKCCYLQMRAMSSQVGLIPLSHRSINLNRVTFISVGIRGKKEKTVLRWKKERLGIKEPYIIQTC